MKRSKNKDKPVIDELKRQIKREKEYEEKFLAARREVKRREGERLTQYGKFKKQQEKETRANEMLEEFLKQS
jgi:hypothetical protein